VPWAWLTKAAQQPGKALHVAIALWFVAGITRVRTVALPGASLRLLGVSRYAAYRALTALEQAGLVAVARHPGRKPMVTILEPGEDP
jgi:DNA-binding MarR family transcriptional regulator